MARAAGGRAPDCFLLKADIPEADEVLRRLAAPPGPGEEAPLGPDLTRAIEAATGVAVAGAPRLTGRGTFRWVVSAELADGRPVVARINRLAHPALVAGLAREAALGPGLRAAGVPAPAALGLDLTGDAIGSAFGVFLRIEGATLGSVDPNESRVVAGLRSLGSRLRALHELRLPGAGPVETREGLEHGAAATWVEFLLTRMGDHLEGCLAAGALDGREARLAEQRLAAGVLESATVTDRVLHADPGGPNVVLSATDEVVGLLDWEDALVGDPVFDVAGCALFHPERRWPSLFQGYFGTPVLPAEYGAQFWRYALRIALARTVARRRFGINDLPGRIPAATRVRRALAGLEEVAA